MDLMTTISGWRFLKPAVLADTEPWTSATRTIPVDVSESTADQGPDPRPESFGRYRVLRSLGRGSFGEVFLAHDADLNRPVAVKVQRAGRPSRPFDADDFIREAQLVAHLDHPGIVPVHDVGRTGDGLCYIVSKYIEGMTLSERLRQGRPAFEESARVVRAVALALQYAHEAGIVHRDLKPSNILIARQGDVFLTDFGIALTASDVDQTASVVGTPAYMSPEQARGESHLVDGRSDVFSLGTLFYELLTGRHPFAKAGPPELVLDSILCGDPMPPRQVDGQVPAALERVCLKALAKRPEDRYATAGEMAADVRTAPGARRFPWPRAALVLIVVMVAVLSLVWANRVSVGGLREGADVRTARWVLERGGSLSTTADRGRVIRALEQLPGSFVIGSINLGMDPALRDEDLPRLPEVRHLTALDLHSTSITDHGLEVIGRMTNLLELWLNQTGISGKGLKSLAGLRSLVHLDLNGTTVTDEGLDAIGKLEHLAFLDLSYTRITDQGLSRLRGLSALEVLRLKNTGITDAGLAELKSLKNLRTLVLADTSVTSDGIAALRGELTHCQVSR